MSKQKMMYVLLIAGSCAYVGDVAKIEAKFDEVVDRFVKDGWMKPEFVQRHQNGNVVQMWLTHSTRLNQKKLPSKMSVAYQEAEVV